MGTTKQKEIQMLWGFKGMDGYFNEYFSDKDIDQMCENIKNDHPIEFNTDFAMKEAKMKQALDKERRDSKEAINSLCRSIVKASEEDFCDGSPVYDIIVSAYGLDNVIKTKHEFGIKLTESELDYLVSKI